MTVAYIAEFGLILVFAVTAIWALAWAIRSGQFSDFRRGAASIFDDEEPIGRMTDSFPEPPGDAPPKGDTSCQP